MATHYGSLSMFLDAINKAIQVGECKSDDEILLELGKCLNPAVFPWETMEEFLSWEMDQYIPGMTFAELREKKWTVPEWHYEKYRNGLQNFDGPKSRFTISPIFASEPASANTPYAGLSHCLSKGTGPTTFACLSHTSRA